MSKETSPERIEKEEKSSDSKEAEPASFDNFLASPSKENDSNWIMRVIHGPNAGAQLNLKKEKIYTLGSAKTSDIVLLDPGISKEHLSIKISKESKVNIKDLKSTNGTFVNGSKVETFESDQTCLLKVGNSAIIISDTSVEQQTIVVPKEEKNKSENESIKQDDTALFSGKHLRLNEAKAKSLFKKACLLTAAFVFVLISSLFIERPTSNITKDPINVSDIAKILNGKSFSFSFDDKKRQVMLHGHTMSEEEKNDVVSQIKSLSFVESIDSRRLVLDSLLCKEFNSVINSQWPSVSIKAISPGKYVLEGMVKEQTDADKIDMYMQLNFPYNDKLTNQITVEESMMEMLNERLQELAPNRIAAQMVERELVIAGTIPEHKEKELADIIDEFKKNNKIKLIKKSVIIQKNIEKSKSGDSAIDLSSEFSVSGYAQGSKDFDVIINGKILNKGSSFENMKIIDITDRFVFLEKDGEMFKIAFNTM